MSEKEGLFKSVFDPESLFDESGQKSSARRIIVVLVMFLLGVFIIGCAFAIFKNKVGTDVCKWLGGFLASAVAWMFREMQKKSKEVLVSKNQASAVSATSIASGQNTDPSNSSATSPSLGGASCKVNAAKARSRVGDVLRTIALLAEHPPQKSVRPVPPMTLLSLKSVEQSIQEARKGLDEKGQNVVRLGIAAFVREKSSQGRRALERKQER